MNAERKSTDALRYEPADASGVGVLWFDCPGKKLNTLSVALMDEVPRVLAAADRDTGCRALVIASAKESGFIAGADIGDLDAIRTAAEGARLSRSGQEAMGRIAELSVPTVAAIHGDCLGGGLELALACTARVASAAVRTKLALPEVMLGLLPGAGGTQRLPLLVGLTGALDMMLTGRNIRAKKALKMGLVDQVVPANQLLGAARALAARLAAGTSPPPKRKISTSERIQALLLEKNPLGRRVVLRAARKKVIEQTGGVFPAPLKILDVVARGTYAAEAQGFGELLATAESRGLRHLFHCITALKKDNGPGTEGLEPAELGLIGVLGAGLMGAGVATVLADKGVSIRLKDRDHGSLDRAMDYAKGVFGKARKRRRYGKAGYDERMNRISGSLDYAGFGQAEMVIEAVFEDMDLKRTMVADIEANTRADAIFATNTSSLPIGEIAKMAAHPERVIGMHFFSPVEKMPLVEVIVTDQTDPQVTATTVGVARRMGKHVIVVRDCAGFYTTRALAPYMVEATNMAFEGYDPRDIDEAAKRAGFPVGPITLMDEVGIDVGAKVLGIMRQYYSERMEIPDSAMTDAFLAEGRLGRKAGKGFYLYEKGESKTRRGRKLIDPAIRAHLPATAKPRRADFDVMSHRLLLSLVNEAAWCLHDGILRDAAAGDLGAVMGIGFPPALGGPLFYADERGLENIVDQLRQLETEHGRRFAPCPLLVSYAEQKKRFHG